MRTPMTASQGLQLPNFIIKGAFIEQKEIDLKQKKCKTSSLNITRLRLFITKEKKLIRSKKVVKFNKREHSCVFT